MRSTWIVATTTVRGILRPRNLIWIAILLLFVLPSLFFGPLQMRKAALAAGEPATAATVLASAAAHIFSFATGVFVYVGMFFGLSAVSNEAKQRTIVTLLARPIARWQLVVGKWLGICGMLWGLDAVVLGVVVAAFAYTAVWPSPMFWMVAADSFVQAMLITGASIALGVVFSPMGGLAVMVLLSMGQGLAHAGDRTLALLGWALVQVWPAGMPAHLISDGLSNYTLDPSYGLYAAVMVENVLYACSLVGLALIVFDRRDVRLAAD